MSHPCRDVLCVSAEQAKAGSARFVRQSGQALAEAAVVLMVAVTLFVAISTACRHQLAWHEDMLGTHTLALSIAHGHRDVANGPMSGPQQGLARTWWDRAAKAAGWLVDAVIGRIGAKIPLPGQKTGVGTAIGRSVLNAGKSMALETLSANDTDTLRVGLNGFRHLDVAGRGRFDSSLKMNQGHEIRTRIVQRRELPENAHVPALLGGAMQWVEVKSRSRFANHAWQIRGHGAVAYTHDTIDRIDGAQALWQGPARQSRALVKRLSPMVKKVDDPWGRAAPPTDWLSKWSEVSDVDVPEQSTGWTAIVSDVVDELAKIL